MIHRDTIFKILGSLLFIEVAIMLACFAMAIGFGEDDEMPFAISIVLTLLTGIVLRYLGRHSDNTMSRRDAYLVVSLSWVIFSLFGTLPFVISGYIPSFTDAYFETMSGFTTTGATILDIHRHHTPACCRIGQHISPIPALPHITMKMKQYWNFF